MLAGHVVQLNISNGGVPKRAVAEADVLRSGIRGDLWAHPKFHGGPEQALLLISLEVIERLTARGYPLFPGALGENLTTAGIDHKALRGGQRFQAGSVLLELTKVRVPCRTLDVYGPTIQAELYDRAVKAGDVTSPRWAMSGFYARVVEPGRIIPGDIIRLVDSVCG
jgi:MOSC domain-containing protein YiiM